MQLKNLYLIVILIFLLSCNAIDKEETIPSYIFIEKIDLEVNSDGSQGTNAHDIKDAWILVNGSLAGVFELPCKVPVLSQGKTEITIIAGIKVNGQSNNRKFYPFYDTCLKIVNLKPAQIDTIKAKVKYKPAVKFVWKEDFEDMAVSLEKTGITRTVDTMLITGNPNEVYDYGKIGNKYSGKVDFRGKRGTFENSSITIFDFPRSTTEIYMEVNYKSDVPIQFGLYPTSGSTIDIGIPVYMSYSNPDEWKKAYIRLSPDVNSSYNAGKKFRIFINAVNSEDKNAVILIDNIKVLHF